MKLFNWKIRARKKAFIGSHIPDFPDQENCSLSFKSLKTCSSLIWRKPLLSFEIVSTSFRSLDEVPENPWSSLPTSKRASATSEGRQLWYNHSKRCALSESKIPFDGFGKTTGPPTSVDFSAGFCWENPTTTWKSGTRRRTSRSISFRLLHHCPSSSLSSKACSIFWNTCKTFEYLIRHFASAIAVQCWTRDEEDCKPLDILVLVFTEGKIFSRMFDSGGGEGLYIALSGRKNDDEGVGRDITEPKNEIFAIHLDDRRGSSVNAAPDQ